MPFFHYLTITIKHQKEQSLHLWGTTWKHKVTPGVGKVGAQQSVLKVLSHLTFLFRCDMLPKVLGNISENETTILGSCEMKGSSLTWLEEVS